MILRSLSLNSTIKSCDHCLLRAAKGLGIGNPDASMLLLAQNPGTKRDENTKRIPFSLHLWESKETTKSSDVLRKIMTEVGFTLDDFYVTNTMKCEGKIQDVYIEKCSDWLEGELLNLRRLKLIVALGDVAGRRLGHRAPFKLNSYQSRIDPDFRWTVGYVNHPAATLYPGGVPIGSYLMQWQFVKAVFDRLTMDERTR